MAQIALPNNLTNGTVADATQVMANFQAITDVVNGNLGSDNLGSITGADVTAIDLNGGSSPLNNFTQRFQAGSIICSNIQPNSSQQQSITFPVPFPGKPLIFTAVNAGTAQDTFVSFFSQDQNGFSIDVYNGYNDVRSPTVPWLAVYTGAWS